LKNSEINEKVKRKIAFSFSILLLSILVLVTYWKSFENEFVDWDDFGYVVNNELVRQPDNSLVKDLFSTPVVSNYHPLTVLSLRLNNNFCSTCLNGISPRPFIRWNVILHLLNTILVFVLIYLLTKKNILTAFLVAVLFGVHPMHVESVVWISERKDVLYSFFFLSGLIAYLNYKENGRGKILWLLFALFLFILSCLSKGTAVVFPVVLVLINFWIFLAKEEFDVWAAIKEAVSLKNLLILLPFIIISLFFGLLTYKTQSGENFLGILDLSKKLPDMVDKIGPFSILQRFGIASYGFIGYLIKFFVPLNLIAIYPYPPIPEINHGTFHFFLLLSSVAVILIAFLIVRSLKTSGLYAFGIGFYFVTIALVLQFIPVGMAIMADRYSYLPYIGLSLIPATLIANSARTKKIVLLIIAGCFVVVMMILTKQQIRIWRNTETLWSKVIEKYPATELARASRGKYYSKKALQTEDATEKKTYEDKALIDFREAIKAGSKNPDVYLGTGILLGTRADLKNAILFLNTAISLDPKKGSAYYNRGITFGLLKRNTEAIRDYNLALQYAPEKAIEIRTNRSNLYLATGRIREAVADMDYLISKDSKNVVLYFNRGVARQHLNNIPGAIADFRKALEISPNDTLSKQMLQKLIGK
jgi:hypothetical protein